MAIIFLRPPSWQQSLGSMPEASPNLDASRAGIRLAWKNVSGLEFGVKFVSCFPYVVGRVMIFKRSHDLSIHYRFQIFLVLLKESKFI